jgi:hypothetical protein
MKTSTLNLIPILFLLSFQASAQDHLDVCGLELRNELIDLLMMQPICDHYSPQTGSARSDRLAILQSTNPVCYEKVSSDQEMMEVMEDLRKKIPEIESSADQPEEKIWIASLKESYAKKCESLASGDSQPAGTAGAR